MEKWHALELEYAQKLRTSSRRERKELYREAYSVVSAEAMKLMPPEPEKRVSGTSRRLIDTIARHCHKEQAVLEVGCGRGFTCLCLAPHVGTIVGTDVSEPALAEARELLRRNHVTNATIVQLGADELTKQFPQDTFDVAISIDVIEHLHPEDAAEHLKETLLVLKPGGRCIIATPNRLTGPHDITRLVHPDASVAEGFHLNETTGVELASTLRRLGFRDLRVVPPFISRSRLSRGMTLPFVFQRWLEMAFCKLHRPRRIRRRLARQLGLVLIARKPKEGRGQRSTLHGSGLAE